MLKSLKKEHLLVEMTLSKRSSITLEIELLCFGERKHTEKLTQRACVCLCVCACVPWCLLTMWEKVCLPVCFRSSRPFFPSFVSEVPLPTVLCFSVYRSVKGTERFGNTHVFTQTHRHRETSPHSHTRMHMYTHVCACTHTHTQRHKHSHVQGQHSPYTGDTPTHKFHL